MWELFDSLILATSSALQLRFCALMLLLQPAGNFSSDA